MFHTFCLIERLSVREVSTLDSCTFYFSYCELLIVFDIVCFYCILGLLLIFYMYICRILLIQLLGCHIEINACLKNEDTHQWHNILLITYPS